MGCDRFGGSAREGGGRALYLLTPYGWWLRAQVSRDAPPPLPGGYKVGEKVFFTGASRTLSSGDKVVHGQQGEVTGPATAETHKGKGVDVRFPGNKGDVCCYLIEVRRLGAVPAATPRAPRPHTHATLTTPRASPRQPLPRRPSPHCMSSRSRRGPLPGCGGAGGRGRVSGWLLRWQRQRGRLPTPSLPYSFGW